MHQYSLQTTVDITRSLAERDSQDPIAQGQQSNFNTLLQTIGLRANIEWSEDPKQINDYWYWTFQVERADVFLEGNNPVALLQQDLNGVPVIGNLTNTFAVYPPVFRSYEPDANVWIEFNS